MKNFKSINCKKLIKLLLISNMVLAQLYLCL